MEDNVSLFTVDETTGEIVYEPADVPDEVIQDNPAGESEIVEDGNVIDQTVIVGDMVPTEEIIPENVVETEEDPAGLDILDPGGDAVPVVLSEEVTAAILAASPAGGTIGSSTLDYFDRIASGLSADCKYIAYRTSSDNSYDAVLYYGEDYEVSENMITFGDDAVQVEVERVSSSGYNTETYYTATEISDTSVSFNQSGTVLYYTNAVPGYPVLGGYEQPAGYAPLITAALIGALCLVVLQKLLLRR